MHTYTCVWATYQPVGPAIFSYAKIMSRSPESDYMQATYQYGNMIQTNTI